MRSYLTRRIVQQILKNQPILHRGCIQRLSTAALNSYKAPTSTIIRQPQQRGLWWSWLTGKPRKTLKAKKIAPGMDVLSEQEDHIKMGTRKYSNQELVAALQAFFTHKSPRKVILDTQIMAVLATYKYLLKEQIEHDETAGLTVQDTLQGLELLNSIPKFGLHSKLNSNAFMELALLLFDDVRARESEWPKAETSLDEPVKEGQSDSAVPNQNEAREFISLAARRYLEAILYRLEDTSKINEVYRDLLEDYPQLAENSSIQQVVLCALAFRGQNDQLKSFLDELRIKGSPLPSPIWSSIIHGAILAEDIESIKKWYSYRPQEDADHNRRIKLDVAILRLCITSGNMAWGQSLLNEFVEKTLSNKAFRENQMTMILMWAMASGRGVDDLEKMLDVLTSRLQLNPTIEVMNALLEMTKVMGDAYYAERLLTLIRKRSIRFDATTYRLEMEWRLLANDISGALHSYNKLQSEEFELEDITPTVNQLILALVKKEPVAYEQVTDLVKDFIEQEGEFSAELVAALSRLHLERSELFELADLLHTYAASFTTEERSIVRAVFINHISESEEPEAKWDAYTFIKSVFPETSEDARLDIMEQFFANRMFPQGTRVFGDMRAAFNLEDRPGNAGYIRFFEGLAFQRKAKPLEVAHNMLRLDTQVEPDTAIKTSLMVAYIMCDRSGMALGIWDEIMYGREGPSYDSINVALKACQHWWEGPEYAKKIWTQLEKQDVDIPKETADSYIAALTAQGQAEKAYEMVASLEELSGGRYKADALTIMAVLNSDLRKRAEFLKWAEETYPELLKQVEAAGMSPFRRRYLLEPLLPKDGSYKGRWGLVPGRDWEGEHIDWTKLHQKIQEEGLH